MSIKNKITTQMSKNALHYRRARDDALYKWPRLPYFTDSVSKNAPTFTSCSFDKHGLILIMFGKQHQQSFRNDMRIQLSLSFHFYLLVCI